METNTIIEILILGVLGWLVGEVHCIRMAIAQLLSNKER